MLWWQNIPFFSIILSLFSAAVCSLLPSAGARRWARGVLILCAGAAAMLLGCLLQPGQEAFTFMMGHFPAPWGNEIRCGQLEALLACAFPAIMCCALLAGQEEISGPGNLTRENLYHALCMLLNAALLSQIYSNDLFTCYVFLEIMTLTACALLVYPNTGRALAAGLRYMVLNLVGSGLFLLGIVLLYDLTGHLLMENLYDSLQPLLSSGEYHRSLTVILALITVGLGIKSALFPFHSWVQDAYSAGISPSHAILSSLVSKGYIILLLKIYVRVFGWDLVLLSGIDRVLMVFSLSGMIVGSIAAIRTRRFIRMIAWSSVAQIGYIYLGISLGAGGGYQAAVYHLMVHSFSKALLLLAGERLRQGAGSDGTLRSMTGAARARPVTGVRWTLAAFCLIGLPFTGGLISKLLLGEEALRHSLPVAIAVLTVLALSTLLNVMYFGRAAILIWSPRPEACPAGEKNTRDAGSVGVILACGVLALGILLTFFLASPLLRLISQGLAQF